MVDGHRIIDTCCPVLVKYNLQHVDISPQIEAFRPLVSVSPSSYESFFLFPPSRKGQFQHKVLIRGSIQEFANFDQKYNKGNDLNQ